jgi:membrane protein DedA with SNARE-associated domain
MKLVILGRLATFPNYLMGSAAGSSGMDAKKFILADGIGTTLEFVVSLGLGFAIGSAGSTAKAIVVGSGVAALSIAATIYGAQLHRQKRRHSAGTRKKAA